ncbi:hypothetical protein LGQ02_14095 [Bacillus shivajii]|uniref:hypothetical protein n=1 Tax=Bacillus shivajii TaxID=1983719 RepID=UPI001CFAE87B|nr:hypothetical protein [Bacillus shivajii]UCZ51976.1 hypothetical protein LGQ02_14095 [Bacillus shivajii]
MLNATITYKDKIHFYETIAPLNCKFDGTNYFKQLSNQSTRKITISHDEESHKILFSLPNEVSFEECQKANTIIRFIADNVQGEIDDERAQLGYDEEGKPVYIYHRFEHWVEFIDEAKHRSLEGQKVAVLHGKEILGEGLLLTFKKEQPIDDSSQPVISCTLLTTDGEESFYGELKVEPITQW